MNYVTEKVEEGLPKDSRTFPRSSAFKNFKVLLVAWGRMWLLPMQRIQTWRGKSRMLRRRRRRREVFALQRCNRYPPSPMLLRCEMQQQRIQRRRNGFGEMKQISFKPDVSPTLSGVRCNSS